jgi:hypothetical protein
VDVNVGVAMFGNVWVLASGFVVWLLGLLLG